MKVQVVEKSGLYLPTCPVGYRAYLARWVGETPPEWGEFGVLQHIDLTWCIVAGGKINYGPTGYQGNLIGRIKSRHSKELGSMVYRLNSEKSVDESDCCPEFIIVRELNQITFE